MPKQHALDKSKFVNTVPAAASMAAPAFLWWCCHLQHSVCRKMNSISPYSSFGVACCFSLPFLRHALVHHRVLRITKATISSHCVWHPQVQIVAASSGKSHCPSTTLAKKIETAARTWHRRVIYQACTRLCLACVPVSIFLARVVIYTEWPASSAACLGCHGHFQGRLSKTYSVVLDEKWTFICPHVTTPARTHTHTHTHRMVNSTRAGRRWSQRGWQYQKSRRKETLDLPR